METEATGVVMLSTFRILASLLLLAAGVSADFPAGPDSVLTLENGTAKLTLGRTPAWHIASVRFPGAGFEAVPAEPIPLYQLDWYEKGSLETLNSFQARQAEAGKLLDASKPLPVSGRQVLIVRRSL
jgi:hypothetical protein